MLYMCIVTYIICRLYIDLAVSFMVLQKSSPRFSPVDFFLGFAVLSFPGEPWIKRPKKTVVFGVYKWTMNVGI